MIICAVNDAKKKRIFSVRPRFFVHLNNPNIFERVICEEHTQVAITTNQEFSSYTMSDD